MSRPLRTALLLLGMGLLAIAALNAIACRMRARIPQAGPGTSQSAAR